jgi:hypothetical protein
MPTDTGGNITVPFYTEEDNVVLFPTINSTPLENYSFDMLLDFAVVAAQPPTTLLTPPGVQTTGRSISKSNPVNRDTEFVSNGDDCHITVPNKGWHSLIFKVVASGEEVAVEGIVTESLKSVIENDVLGGISAKVVWTGGALDTAKSINIDDVSFAQGAGKMEITFSKDLNVDNLQYLANSRDNLDSTSSHIQFNNSAGFFVYWSKTVANVTTLFTPDAATVYVYGGK